MSIPSDVREHLSMLRESFLHKPEVQDWVGTWWARLSLDDRRLLLALAGLDDSVGAARRKWPQLLQENRDALLSECKRVARLVEALKWA